MFKKIFMGYLAVLLVAFIVPTLAFSYTVRQYLINDTIASLERVAETLSSPTDRKGMHGGGHMRFAFFGLASRIAYADYLLLQEDGLILDSSDRQNYPPETIITTDDFMELAFGSLAADSFVSNDCIAVAYPVRTDGSTTPAALVLYTEPGLLNQLNRAISGIMALALGIGIAISLVAGVLATRVVVGPIHRLKTRAYELAFRRFEGKIELHSGDELEELALAFNEMSERLAAYDQAQKDFFRKASHELKTPLMSVQGYAEAVKEGIIPPEESGQALEIVIKEAERMKTLVNELLYLSKMDAPGEVFLVQPLSLKQTVNEAADALRSLALSKGITLRVHCVDDSHLVQGDPEKLHRLFLNTIGNAVHHARGEVKVSVGNGSIVIEDDGPGFTPGEEEKAFESFYSKSDQGSGLGLAISRAIIEKHGGTISAATRPEGGGRITIVFPIATAQT